MNNKNLKNVSIKEFGNIASLIKDSKVVIGFQSSALIESLILKKPIIVPYFNVNNSEKFKRCTWNSWSKWDWIWSSCIGRCWYDDSLECT